MSIKEKINYDNLLDLNELEEAVEGLTSEERMELVKELYPDLKMKVVPMGEGNRGENKYKITLSNNGFKFNTTFSDSLYNTWENNRSSDFEMLYCIIMDAECYDNYGSTLNEFADNMGFDLYTDEKRALKVLRGCEKAYNNINSLVGEEGYNVLLAITSNF